MSKKLLVILIILLFAAAFYGQANFNLFSKPCSKPIEYSLGTFDDKFDISQEDFLSAVDQAATLWEVASGRDLFKYTPNGKLKINLIYDYRQEATEKLKDLGLTIDDTKSSYDNLKARYDGTTLDYNTLKQTLDAEIANYDSRRKAYDEQVSYWNKQGGAPKNVANSLNKERDALVVLAERINRDKQTVNQLVDTLNAMVDVLNRMAQALNLSVENYNNVGASRGEEFEEALYSSVGRKQEIDIYQFDTEDKLIRVTAHELGHALGLEHVEDPEAIMYRLNQSKNKKPTQADLAELQQLCGIGQ